MKYFVYFLDCLLLVMVPVTVLTSKPTITVAKVTTEVKKVKSSEVAVKDEKVETPKEEEKIEEKAVVETTPKEETKTTTETTQEEKTAVKNLPDLTPKDPPAPSTPPAEQVKNDNTMQGELSGYSPECRGCTGYTSSGQYVGEGNIYYNDKTYGNIRIVAGDYSLPLGTVIKIGSSRVSSTPITAIVLDRGGNIGIGKKFLFDLLFNSNEEALKYEVSYGVNFEILRKGY